MKMSKKILSVILAVLMAFSTFAVTLSASAAEEPVKPEYTENVTEEDIATLFEDVDTLLVNKVLKGSVIESIFKALPGLSGTIMSHGKSIEFYSDGFWNRSDPSAIKVLSTAKKWVEEYGQECYVSTIQVDYHISTPTTKLNQERFANLEDYGDHKTFDNLNPGNKYGVKEYVDTEGNPYGGAGRFDKGNVILDVAEEKDDQGQVIKEAVEGTFTKFFKEHPIVVNSVDDFKNEINNVIATVLMDGLGLVGALGNEVKFVEYQPETEKFPGYPDWGMKPEVYAHYEGGAPDALYDIFAALDDICAGLGIHQDNSATECLEWTNRGQENQSVSLWPNGSESTDLATVYLQNIVNALFDGGLVKNVVGVLQNLVDEENGAKLYKGIALLIDALKRAIDSPFGANLGVTTTTDKYTGEVVSREYSKIGATVKNIYDTFQSIPTTGEGDAKRFDVQGLIGFLIKDVLHMDGTIQIVFDQKLFDESFDNARHKKPLGKANVELIFKPMADDLAKVAAAESPADAAKFVVDYLYETALLNKYNNSKLYNIFSDNLLNLDDEIVNFAMDVIDPDDDVKNVPKPLDELLPMAFSAVGEMVDHHVNLEKHEAKEVTCTEDGCTATYYYCPDCELYFAESEDVEHTPKSEAIPAEEVAKYAVKATGHEFGDVVAAKEATLYDEGNVEYKPCTKCEKNFKADADIMAADDTAIENVTIPKREGKLGDINDNGDVDLVDILMAKKYVADLEEFDDVQFKLADVNADEKVDLVDVLAMMKYEADMIDDFTNIPA